MGTHGEGACAEILKQFFAAAVHVGRRGRWGRNPDAYSAVVLNG